MRGVRASGRLFRVVELVPIVGVIALRLYRKAT